MADAPSSSFKVTINKLPELQSALASYPEITKPLLQSAIVGAQAILAKFTTSSVVPVLSGYLLQNWGFDIGDLQARWYPKAAYAPYVEFGTAPHLIVAKNARVLANKKTGQIFGSVVHHPGTKANPFLERIMAAAQPDIDALFLSALDKVNQQVAAKTA
jgi:hypothetical protein